jgi:hypothetical protein
MLGGGLTLTVMSHEMNRDRKLLLKTVEIGLSGFRNWMIWFCWDRRQSGASLGFDEMFLLRSNDVYTVKRCEPQQLWRLWWRLRDLIEEKMKRIEKLGKNMKNINSIDLVGDVYN